MFVEGFGGGWKEMYAWRIQQQTTRAGAFVWVCLRRKVSSSRHLVKTKRRCLPHRLSVRIYPFSLYPFILYVDIKVYPLIVAPLPSPVRGWR